MENLSDRLSQVRKSIKFNKCFRDDESKQIVIELKKEESMLLKEMNVSVSNTNNGGSMFSNDLVVRKYQYQLYLVEKGEYTMEEVVTMSMVELRSAVDELNPITITQTSVTVRGGKTKRVTVLKVG